ncbi:MAG: lipopolysaccharide biosynthesis [Polaromonas sp.]|nr:lipopolysaccharide biosynthesis [Polaromonas sp.]
MQENQNTQSEAIEEPGLLDLLVVLAENLKLLIIGPLVVGVIALGISFVLPKTFQSIAVIQADQGVASLMLAAPVLDPVINALGLAKGESIEDARNDLRDDVKAVIGRTDKLLTLTVSARTASQAQGIANALIQKAFEESRPKAGVLMRLKTQLNEAQIRLKNAQEASAGVLKRLESNGSTATGVEMAKGYADLLSATGAAQSQVSALEAQIEGLSATQIMQPPTLPEKATRPKKGMVAVGATLATGLALLLFIFMRHAFRKSTVNESTQLKLSRIRRALGLK